MTRDETGRAPVAIEMWADLGCPWCYLGKHRLQRAIGARPDRERFTIRIRSFELRPELPREPETIESALVRMYGDGAQAVLDAERRFQALAQHEGLAFSLDRSSANTFDLHRLVHHAQEFGKGTELFSRVQDRYFAGEISPADTGALIGVAESLGLSGTRVREVLAGEEYAAAVLADVEEGKSLGARGVPFTVFGGRIAFSGARSSAEYAQALEETISTLPTEATA